MDTATRLDALRDEAARVHLTGQGSVRDAVRDIAEVLPVACAERDRLSRAIAAAERLCADLRRPVTAWPPPAMTRHHDAFLDPAAVMLDDDIPTSAMFDTDDIPALDLTDYGPLCPRPMTAEEIDARNIRVEGDWEAMSAPDADCYDNDLSGAEWAALVKAGKHPIGCECGWEGTTADCHIREEEGETVAECPACGEGYCVYDDPADAYDDPSQ